MPGLPRGRHRCGPRDNAAITVLADRRKKRGLVARRIRDFCIGNAEGSEIILDEGDESEVGFRASVSKLMRRSRIRGVTSSLSSGMADLRMSRQIHRSRIAAVSRNQPAAQLRTRRAYGESSENTGISASNNSPFSFIIR